MKDIKELLKKRTVSTYELAEKTGVTRQTINNIAQGKTKPSFLTVKKYALISA